MNLCRCFTGVHCWIVGKPVSWTLDADRPRKTGSGYNDTLNGVRKPKGSVTMSRKLTVLIHCLVGDFRIKLHWGGGVKIPPVAGTRVNLKCIKTLYALKLAGDRLLLDVVRMRTNFLNDVTHNAATKVLVHPDSYNLLLCVERKATG